MSESLRPGGRGRDSRVVTSSMRSEGDIEMTSAQLQWQKQFMFRMCGFNFCFLLVLGILLAVLNWYIQDHSGLSTLPSLIELSTNLREDFTITVESTN